MSKKTPAATPAAEPTDAAKVQDSGKVTVRSKTGAAFINPFTNEVIEGAPVEVTKDNWLDSQVAADKIEIV